eukprot:TRINITY_DN2750_c0_g1_i7.p3 TRINITY_DN2750_c0_g1~~TRINITY_DN2750_c0_g1_i7.p3  ORF type:complete len:239 (+),score=16.33 TRINITY_DN2750_c0_g1_i7:106-717(+)
MLCLIQEKIVCHFQSQKKYIICFCFFPNQCRIKLSYFFTIVLSVSTFFPSNIVLNFPTFLQLFFGYFLFFQILMYQILLFVFRILQLVCWYFFSYRHFNSVLFIQRLVSQLSIPSHITYIIVIIVQVFCILLTQIKPIFLNFAARAYVLFLLYVIVFSSYYVLHHTGYSNYNIIIFLLQDLLDTHTYIHTHEFRHAYQSANNS